jgi:hypothetical protein
MPHLSEQMPYLFKQIQQLYEEMPHLSEQIAYLLRTIPFKPAKNCNTKSQ